MKANIRRKLAMSVGAAVMTTCCLTSTTYAWFARNANAWTDPYEMKLHTSEGLEISVDGENFYDSVSKEQLEQAIALYRYNLAHADNTKKYGDLTEDDVNKYKGVSIQPVSLAYDKLKSGKPIEFNGFNQAEQEANPLHYINNDGYYVPENLTEAAKTTSYIPTCYIAFDLSFRCIASSNSAKNQYNLVFATGENASGLQPGEPGTGMPESYIKGNDCEVELNNKLSIPARLDTRTGEGIIKGKYNSGDKITINPANAMRLAVVSKDKNTLIFEPNLGYGSTAVKNYEGIEANKDLHDPEQNPMVTYFNNTHNLGKLYVPEVTLTSELVKMNEESPLEVFQRTDDNYNIITLTFYLWLDGYDADYIEGVDTDSIHFFLNFTKQEVI